MSCDILTMSVGNLQLRAYDCGKKMQLLKNNNFTVILITCSERGAKYRISLLTLNVLSNNLEL